MPRPQSDSITSSSEALVAIPRLAEEVGVTPRVMRYWEEQGLISPSRERGKLRYAPHDLAIARLVKRLLDDGVGIDGVRALRTLSEREVQSAVDRNDESYLAELALRILYARKAFRDLTSTEPDRFLHPHPELPRPPGDPKHAPPRGPKHRAEHGPGGPPDEPKHEFDDPAQPDQ
jgi:DNA-binding transcriptional MerR regulator